MLQQADESRARFVMLMVKMVMISLPLVETSKKKNKKNNILQNKKCTPCFNKQIHGT